MIEALADQVELNSLAMMDHKQSWLASARQRLNDGVASMAATANGLATAAGLTTAPTATPETTGDPSTGIKNRSPETSTVNNHYPAPPAVAAKSDAPWIALIVIALGMGAAAWYASQPKAQPQPLPAVTTPPSQPGSVQVPGGYNLGAQPYNPFQQ